MQKVGVFIKGFISTGLGNMSLIEILKKCFQLLRNLNSSFDLNVCQYKLSNHIIFCWWSGHGDQVVVTPICLIIYSEAF